MSAANNNNNDNVTRTEGGVIVTDQSIQEYMLQYLYKCDLENVTLKSIRKVLEGHFKCSLQGQSRKDFLVATLNLFLDSRAQAANDAAAVRASEAEAKDEVDFGDEDIEIPRNAEKPVNTSAFTRPQQLSSELAEFMGTFHSSRTSVVKALWEHIRQHNLQNPADKREIILDETLTKIFKRKTVTMFSMNKYLSSHLKALEDLPDIPVSPPKKPKTGKAAIKEEEAKAAAKVKAKAAKEKEKKKKAAKEAKEAKAELKAQKLAKAKAKEQRALKKAKKREREEAEGEGEDVKDPKKRKGLNRPLILSDELAAFIGLAEESRVQVVKKLWAYIREHNLQNPAKKSEFILDDAMRDVFKVDTMTMFSMHKYLSAHFKGPAAEAGEAGEYDATGVLEDTEED